MANPRNRERDSSLLQTVTFAATLAICLLAFLVIKTLSLDQSQHQLRLAALRTASSLDLDLNRYFLRTLASRTEGNREERQQLRLQLAQAVNALQEGPQALDGLSPALDLAMKDYYEVVLSKLDMALEVKASETERLQALISQPTTARLGTIEQAYQGWYQAKVEETNFYRLLLIVYTTLLLASLAYLGFRLRLSYQALDRANVALRDANRTLESQVQARTKDLTKTLNDLRESQAQLIQSEKMASLGQMVAGVAHEINTPLGYARSNSEIVRTALGDIRQLCESQGRALSLLTAANSSEQEISDAIAQAEEQRQNLNPEELMGDLENLLGDTDHGLLQIADLVASLKDFSRVDRSRTDLFDLNAGIDSALKICNSQLKGRIDVVRYFGKLPEIECSPSQINQVFMNLINNAAQAIANEGVITIETAVEKSGVVVKVSDTGAGMSEEVKKRIFEPFFTTKPVGKGTGLGLSIVFRIIEEHAGRIHVESKEGEGTTFSVHLPLRQPQGATKPLAAAA